MWFWIFWGYIALQITVKLAELVALKWLQYQGREWGYQAELEYRAEGPPTDDMLQAELRELLKKHGWTEEIQEVTPDDEMSEDGRILLFYFT